MHILTVHSTKQEGHDGPKTLTLAKGHNSCEKVLIKMLQFKHIFTQWKFHRHTSHDQHISTYKQRSRSVGQGVICNEAYGQRPITIAHLKHFVLL